MLGTVLTGTAAHASSANVKVTPEKPAVWWTTNHTTVTAGSTVTFTVTEKARDGSPVVGIHPVFHVRTGTGWEAVRTGTSGTNGATTFAFTPNYTFGYAVEIPAAKAKDGTPVAAAKTATIVVTAKPKDIGPQIVAAAAAEKGKPYVYAAAGPNSFDCSGLVKYVYEKFGINLPHQANAQKTYGIRVSEPYAIPGDLVFVYSGSYAYHVAIYAGNGMWWEAPRPGESVRLTKIWSSDIQYRYVR